MTNQVEDCMLSNGNATGCQVCGSSPGRKWYGVTVCPPCSQFARSTNLDQPIAACPKNCQNIGIRKCRSCRTRRFRELGVNSQNSAAGKSRRSSQSISGTSRTVPYMRTQKQHQTEDERQCLICSTLFPKGILFFDEDVCSACASFLKLHNNGFLEAKSKCSKDGKCSGDKIRCCPDCRMRKFSETGILEKKRKSVAEQQKPGEPLDPALIGFEHLVPFDLLSSVKAQQCQLCAKPGRLNRQGKVLCKRCVQHVRNDVQRGPPDESRHESRHSLCDENYRCRWWRHSMYVRLGWLNDGYTDANSSTSSSSVPPVRRGSGVPTCSSEVLSTGTSSFSKSGNNEAQSSSAWGNRNHEELSPTPSDTDDFTALRSASSLSDELGLTRFSSQRTGKSRSGDHQYYHGSFPNLHNSPGLGTSSSHYPKQLYNMSALAALTKRQQTEQTGETSGYNPGSSLREANGQLQYTRNLRGGRFSGGATTRRFIDFEDDISRDVSPERMSGFPQEDDSIMDIEPLSPVFEYPEIDQFESPDESSQGLFEENQHSYRAEQLGAEVKPERIDEHQNAVSEFSVAQTTVVPEFEIISPDFNPRSFRLQLKHNTNFRLTFKNNSNSMKAFYISPGEDARLQFYTVLGRIQNNESLVIQGGAFVDGTPPLPDYITVFYKDAEEGRPLEKDWIQENAKKIIITVTYFNEEVELNPEVLNFDVPSKGKQQFFIRNCSATQKSVLIKENSIGRLKIFTDMGVLLGEETMKVEVEAMFDDLGSDNDSISVFYKEGRPEGLLTEEWFHQGAWLLTRKVRYLYSML